jgi:hypothetical protein
MHATSRRHGHFCRKYQEDTQINLEKARFFVNRLTNACLAMLTTT